MHDQMEKLNEGSLLIHLIERQKVAQLEVLQGEG